MAAEQISLSKKTDSELMKLAIAELQEALKKLDKTYIPKNVMAVTPSESEVI